MFSIECLRLRYFSLSRVQRRIQYGEAIKGMFYRENGEMSFSSESRLRRSIECHYKEIPIGDFFHFIDRNA